MEIDLWWLLGCLVLILVDLILERRRHRKFLEEELVQVEYLLSTQPPEAWITLLGLKERKEQLQAELKQGKK